MKVLVTGGTGVVGTAAVRHLLERGHEVRLFSRNASRDVAQWPEGVEGREGSVGDPTSVTGIADGCDVVLHIVGIVAEEPPEVTFQRINVEGTRVMVREAERAGVERFVHISSLGADRGTSDYHRSKLQSEVVAQEFSGSTIVLRLANVYGPGDEVVSLLLRMVRTLPAIPVIDGGDHPFQPIWADDCGQALALAVEREDLAGQTLEIAGTEMTSTNKVLDMLEDLTGQHPPRVPLPGWLASTGTRIASLFGVDAPVNENQITMLVEGNFIRDGKENALTEVFGVTPTPLSVGLAKLADTLPESLPSDGVGRLHQRRYWADITGSTMTAERLFAQFKERFAELSPSDRVEVGAEPGTPTRIEEGATLTLALPLRGHCQVRVEEADEHSATFVTIEGHPLSGAIRFSAKDEGAAVRFQVETYDRASNLVDLFAMSTVGRVLKSSTWTDLVEAVVRVSGGTAPAGVQTVTEALDEERAKTVEAWVEAIVMRRKRREEGAAVG